MPSLRRARDLREKGRLVDANALPYFCDVHGSAAGPCAICKPARKSLSGHQSARAKSTTWLTPPEWIEALGPFYLDPCCPEVMPWKTAYRCYTPSTNGLAQEWTGRVWLNPPFGQEWPAWVEKLADHGDGIALIAARTETEAFYRLVWGRADAICFVRGRPHFYDAEGNRAPFNSGAPMALIAYGARNVAALNEADLGVVVPITKQPHAGRDG